HRYRNLVVVRTFSKAWGLAGLRIGAVLADPAVLRALQLLLDPFACTTAAQEALETTLARPAGMRESVGLVRAERERLAAALRELPCVRRVFPSEANFLFVELSAAARALEALRECGAWVSDTGFHVPDTMRIS